MNAKQIASSRFCRARENLRFFILIVSLFALSPRCADADDLDDAVRTLARKVAVVTRSVAVNCEIRNLSSMPGSEFTAVSSAFQEELQRRGVKILVADAPVLVLVSVSQNTTDYLGVVQIQRKDDPQTVMQSLGPVTGPPPAEPTASFVLHREMLFSQERPILDIVFAGDGQLAFALGTGEITSYQWRESRWIRSGLEVLPRQHPPQRSEEGFLSLSADSEAALFPSETCRISASAGTGWLCERATNKPMPIRGSSAWLSPGKTQEWLSAAPFEADGKPQLIATGFDGVAHVYAEGSQAVATFPTWGTQVASLHSGCGNPGGWQLLRASDADWTQVDTIQAMEIRSRQAVAASTPMEFPGPIVTLRTAGTRAAEAASTAKALVVDRNLQTGFYEAYLVSLACSD